MLKRCPPNPRSAYQAAQFDKRYRSPVRGELWVDESVTLLSENDEPQGYLHQFQDLTGRKRAERQPGQLAHYDPLTGLLSREGLHQQARR